MEDVVRVSEETISSIDREVSREVVIEINGEKVTVTCAGGLLVTE